MMIDWCIAHPFLAFLILIGGLDVTAVLVTFLFDITLDADEDEDNAALD